MKRIKLVALHCICADVFDETGEIMPGGEALNFSAHACEFDGIDVFLSGKIGNDDFGKCILDALKDKRINTDYIRVDKTLPTAHNRIYTTDDGDRYFKEDSWSGEIFENLFIDKSEEELLKDADVVFTHYAMPCFNQIIKLKKKYGFLVAVDFDVVRDFALLEKCAPVVDFLMISGDESVGQCFEEFSKKYDGLFNMTLGEQGSVTYHKGKEYRTPAVKVDKVVDTTGCGDSYHAGFVCSYLCDKDINKAMEKGAEIASHTLSHFGGF